jgi:hypothetical protein
LKAPGFNHPAYQVKTRFQSLPGFKFNLYRYTPGAAELLSNPELLAKVTSAEKLAELRAALRVEKELEKRREAGVVVGEDKQKQAEEAMATLMEDPTFAELLLNPDVLALLKNPELLLALAATPGVIAALATMSKEVLASLAVPSVVGGPCTSQIQLIHSLKAPGSDP